MILIIGNQRLEDIKSFYTEYQKDNARSYWVFVTTNDNFKFAVEWNPRKENIEVL